MECMGSGSVPVATHYDFKERLAWSEGYLDKGIETILRCRLPGCVNVRRATQRDDRNGTDYWAERPTLPPISIDVKVRKWDRAATSEQYDDLALETWSVMPTREQPGRVGWSRDATKRTDYILWFWQDTGRFVLAPFAPLCAVFRRYWTFWRAEFETAEQDSGGWHSECVYVPRTLVLEKVLAWMNGNLPARKGDGP